MLKKIIFFTLLSIGFISCNNMNKSFIDSSEGFAVPVQKIDDELILDKSLFYNDFLLQVAKDVDAYLEIENGDSFSIILEPTSAREICTTGHEYYSYEYKYLTSHTVIKDGDLWTCYIYVFSYKCKKCGHLTYTTVHTVVH